MARSLVIVESPAKAKTINKYLGKNFTVKASIGHIMDLPTKTIGIRLPIEDEKPNKKKRGKKRARAAALKPPRKPVTLDDPKIFEPSLQVIPGKGKVVNDLRKAAQKADAVYLAGDPDREGEAISAHLAMVLSKPAKFLIDEAEEENGKRNGNGPKEEKGEQEKAAATPVKGKAKGKFGAKRKEKDTIVIEPIDPKRILRVTFNEITPKAIRAAFENPHQVDTQLVDAQQARRVLDRIVGYKISPLLWDKVRRGLSAGRVQTVALRLIVEREQEIRAFIPREYWSIHAMLDAGEPPLFEARLAKKNGEDIEVKNRRRPRRSLPQSAGRNGRWPVSRKKKRGAALPRRSRHRSCNRRRITAYATRRNAPWPWRSGYMKAWSWAKKDR